MRKIKILWADDEIDLLRPYIIFLEEKGYALSTATNGHDAIDMVQADNFDLILLDENMPGLSGLETLNQIKTKVPHVPVVMITKSEEENIMNAAIGSKIADYLIKPVNPNQILLTIKKNIDQQKLITAETTSAYQSEFSQIGIQINQARTYADWVDIYKKLVYWELELERLDDAGMHDVLKLQRADAGTGFSKFVRANYLKWIAGAPDRPLLSPQVFREKVIPYLQKGEKVFVVVIDNLRYDQWKTLMPIINEHFLAEEDDLFCSILPTATQYARNAMFAGLMPKAIQEIYPQLWLNDDEEGAKNLNEAELLQHQLNRLGVKKKFCFEKILNSRTGKRLTENFSNLLNYDLVVLVYNFIDMLSHANTDMEMIRELAVNDTAYRALTRTWFQYSHLHDMIRLMAEKEITLVLTTDHGSIRVANPVKVIGDRNTSVNLRYKMGRSLDYNQKEVFDVKDPNQAQLPKSNVSSRYIFAMGSDYLIYPNNFNHYANYYKNTFQHGGISPEEMLVPVIRMKPRR